MTSFTISQNSEFVVKKAVYKPELCLIMLKTMCVRLPFEALSLRHEQQDLRLVLKDLSRENYVKTTLKINHKNTVDY